MGKISNYLEMIEDIKNKHGMTAIEVLKKYFSNIHTILAHGVKINNDDLNLDEKWDKLKVYLELIKNQGREIGTQLLEIIVLMAK